MEINLIALAIPFFFVLIGVEWLVARWQGRAYFLRFREGVTAISCGIGSEMVGLMFGGVLFLLYIGVWQNFALFDLSTSSAWVWIVGFLLVDCAYYWWHRAGHRINLIWASHIVHHHSQDYNLAIALRQAWFARVSGIFFRLPLALFGIPPVVFLTCGALNTLYQFWIHTRTIQKLGPLEWVFNTPSHHRVHHGINPQYIDKNYAGVLIIWDRMFGTFEEEQEEVVYGTVAVYRNYDPIWANFHYMVDLAKRSYQTKSLRDAVWLWLMPPDWNPADLGGRKAIPEVTVETFHKWDEEDPAPLGLDWYVGLHFVPTAALVTALLMLEDGLSWVVLFALASLVLWTTWIWGALYVHHRLALFHESLRLAVVTLLVGVVTWDSAAFFGATVATASLSLLSAWWIRSASKRETLEAVSASTVNVG